jgi:hypothetical protein
MPGRSRDLSQTALAQARVGPVTRLLAVLHNDDFNDPILAIRERPVTEERVDAAPATVRRLRQSRRTK